MFTHVVKNNVAPSLHHTPAICNKSYLLSEIRTMLIEDPNKLKDIIKWKNSTTKVSMDMAKEYFTLLLKWFASDNRK